jgi:hypothetical protein
MLVIAVVSAVAGVVIAREFGRTDETDGFFAAYGVFIVLGLAAQAIRIAVLPTLARARDERRLAGEAAGFALALAAVAVPSIVLAEAAASPIADVLTGGGSDAARDAAAEALRWMVPAAVAHLFAGLAASTLAALDDYATAAFGYAVGSLSGLALLLFRVEPDGIIAASWSMALNGSVALGVPLTVLAVRALRSRMPAVAVRPSGPPLPTRLTAFAAAAALPIALQSLYVVCLPFAGRIGTGAVTSFGFAYLASASLVTVSAFSLGVVTSVPLSRAELGAERAAEHVVSASWIALVLVGAAAGVFAVAGAEVVEAVLGYAYGGDIGAEVGRVVAVLSPWMVASVGVNVTFPLLFVAGRLRRLPLIGAAVLAAQVPLAWAAGALLELDGLALALALSTFLILGALLRELGALGLAERGLLVAASFALALALVSFVLPALVLGPVLSALVGLVLYCSLVGLLRPRGLTGSWSYLRALR